MAQYLDSLDFPQTVKPEAKANVSWIDEEIEVSRATYEAYQIMYYAFIALLAVAGLDKFLHILTSWDAYVSPGVAALLHMTPVTISSLAGLVELAIAVTVALKPRYGSWAVTVWLWLIVVNLLATHGYADIILCDLALSAAGVAFIRLSAECN
jgi:hypothetical protein